MRASEHAHTHADTRARAGRPRGSPSGAPPPIRTSGGGFWGGFGMSVLGGRCDVVVGRWSSTCAGTLFLSRLASGGIPFVGGDPAVHGVECVGGVSLEVAWGCVDQRVTAGGGRPGFRVSAEPLCGLLVAPC